MEPRDAAGTWQYGRDERVSDALLRVLTDVADRPVTELPPLQESIDVDSIDQAFTLSPEIESLTFEYAGYEIVVEPTQIQLRE
ncbi:HalOD1 output domain-containing protein [Halosimplex amylolyticum]|uniref:HalOD1 output domain-containing protein n=1 Tax=Halosimplex amylolyticum TaxID=3396616 RepID=UPI003F55BF21